MQSNLRSSTAQFADWIGAQGTGCLRLGAYFDMCIPVITPDQKAPQRAGGSDAISSLAGKAEQHLLLPREACRLQQPTGPGAPNLLAQHSLCCVTVDEGLVHEREKTNMMLLFI